MKRKILAFLLAACAAFSLLTLPAAAEADTGVVQTVRAMRIGINQREIISLGRELPC